MRPRRRHPNTALVAFIKKWRVPFAAATVALQLAAIAMVVVVFPDVSNLWVSVFVLVSGATAGLATLADLLVSAEEAVRADGEDPGDQPGA